MVHTSDVHLGAYATAGERAWSDRSSLVEAAFSRVIDLAIESAAHLLVIAGDFFDNSRAPKETVDFARTQLRRFDGPKLLLPGNHDPLDEGRLYHREDLEADVPGLRIVREHKGEAIEFDDLDLVAWGRGYYDHDWNFRPLEGMPERIDNRWHLAMAHGHIAAGPDDEHRSLLIREDELRAADGHWDYLALGHWEAHADMTRGRAQVIYSGAPMPLTDANERAGWAMMVDFTAEGVSWTPHAVDPRKTGAAAER